MSTDISAINRLERELQQRAAWNVDIAFQCHTLQPDSRIKGDLSYCQLHTSKALKNRKRAESQLDHIEGFEESEEGGGAARRAADCSG
ncbi:hypothetical protein Tdes44962_MAKER09527 [Teratosphaeria destructans]|uniref:Uncharacterized protein n=1 Tax=Teratosphaeria destructans TaxID=418781 RepID=A0A9W7STD0_9PEZI|nr:hypothetical protein Tdes44962_MAKER09527 [Teratosphaeria destructans]